MKTFYKAAPKMLLFVALLATANISQALVIESSQAFNISDVPSIAGPSRFLRTESNTVEQSFMSNGFDSELGTLTSVSVTFLSFYALQAGIEVNDPDSCGPFEPSFLCEDNVEGAGFVDNVVNFNLSTASSGSIATDKSGGSIEISCFAINGNCVFTGQIFPTIYQGTLFESSNEADLLAFIDTDVRMDVSNLAGSQTRDCPGGDDVCTVVAKSDFVGSYRISYTYDAPVIAPEPEPEPVPVPASFVLFGLGLAGLGFTRRRRHV